MKRITNQRTIFLRDYLPIFLLTATCILLLIPVFSDTEFKEVLFPLTGILMVLLAWFLNFRKLNVVCIENDGFIVKEKKIPFKKVLSLNKKGPGSAYIAKYRDGDTIKSFMFIISRSIFFEPSYIKQIKTLINKE